MIIARSPYRCSQLNYSPGSMAQSSNSFLLCKTQTAAAVMQLRGMTERVASQLQQQQQQQQYCGWGVAFLNFNGIQLDTAAAAAAAIAKSWKLFFKQLAVQIDETQDGQARYDFLSCMKDSSNQLEQRKIFLWIGSKQHERNSRQRAEQIQTNSWSVHQSKAYMSKGSVQGCQLVLYKKHNFGL